MAFKNNAIVTLWNNKTTGKIAEFYDKYADLQVSSRKLNRQTNEYETDFSGRVRCLGKAFETLKTLSLEEKMRLKLTDVEVTNKWDKAKNTMFVNYIVWDLEVFSNPEKENDGETLKEISVEDDDNFPF